MNTNSNTYSSAQEKLQNLPLQTIKKIYFMGIKGVGMTALAIIAKQAGFEVAGCDVSDTFITDTVLNKENISIDEGFESEYIVEFSKGNKNYEILLIITGAHGGFANPVSQWAQKNGIHILTQGQAVGLFMDGEIFERPNIYGISVCGSHGKTTISAMCASVMHLCGEDPSYVVGTSEVFPVGAPGHFGTSNLFIAEADEYASDINYDRTPKLFYQRPKYAIINNIDFDHPDFYHDKQHVARVFAEFIHNVPKDTIFFVNGDDLELKDIIKTLTDRTIITYGKDPTNSIMLSEYTQKNDSFTYTVHKDGKLLDSFSLVIPGQHNALNSLPIIGLALELGIDRNLVKNALLQFKGSKRRSEIVGKTEGGAIIIDDYAHHPEEIKTTLNSIKNAFLNKKIVCIFQPHTHSRTKALLSEFAASFSDCSELLLLPVFASAREQNISEDTTSQLLESLQSNNIPVTLLSSPHDVVQYVSEKSLSQDSLILTMGAGDVYKIGYNLVNG